MTKRRSSQPDSAFVIYINNESDEADLMLHKLYRRLPDARARALDMIRVIDESGEDYLYPTRWFAPVKLSPTLTRRLRSETPVPSATSSSSRAHPTPSPRSR